MATKTKSERINLAARPSPHAPLRWPARPKRDDTLAARRRVWTSKCKRYRVVHSHILYGEGSIPDVYYANIFDPHLGRWDLLDGHYGRHRTKNAAMRHCEEANRRPLAE
jgi:hypothetical protein